MGKFYGPGAVKLDVDGEPASGAAAWAIVAGGSYADISAGACRCMQGHDVYVAVCGECGIAYAAIEGLPGVDYRCGACWEKHVRGLKGRGVVKCRCGRWPEPGVECFCGESH